MTPDDELEAALQGDTNAYLALVHRHTSALFALAAVLVPGHADREDLCQDVLLRAFDRLETFDPARGSFRSWLLAIARNRWRNERVRHRPELADLSRHPTAAAPPDAPSARQETFDRLDRALAALPETHRVAFVLAEIHRMPLADVAALEQVPIGTIKSRVSRAKVRLRAALADLKEHR